MSVFNSIATMHKLEAAGLERNHAEILADALADAHTERHDDLVTKSYLKAELSALELRLMLALGTIVGLATAILGFLIALHR